MQLIALPFVLVLLLLATFLILISISAEAQTGQRRIFYGMHNLGDDGAAFFKATGSQVSFWIAGFRAAGSDGFRISVDEAAVRKVEP